MSALTLVTVTGTYVATTRQTHQRQGLVNVGQSVLDAEVAALHGYYAIRGGVPPVASTSFRSLAFLNAPAPGANSQTSATPPPAPGSHYGSFSERLSTGKLELKLPPPDPNSPNDYLLAGNTSCGRRETSTGAVQTCLAFLGPQGPTPTAPPTGPPATPPPAGPATGGQPTQVLPGYDVVEAGIDPQGRIILVANVFRLLSGNTIYGISILRLLPGNLALDPTYGTAGIVTVDGPTSTLPAPCQRVTPFQAKGLILQPDGKVVVGIRNRAPYGCSASTGNGFSSGLVRTLENGALDTTFGNGGFVFPAFQAASPYFNADSVYVESIALSAGGKIVLAGSIYRSLEGTTYPYLARFNANGTRDTTFCCSGGAQSVPFPSGTLGGTFQQLLVKADGSGYAAGIATTMGGLNTPNLVFSFGTNGAGVGGFGSGGLASYNLVPGGGSILTRPYGMAVQNVGGQTRLMVLTHAMGNASYAFKGFRLRPDGQFDAASGVSSAQAPPSANQDWLLPTTIRQLQDGKFLVPFQIQERACLSGPNRCDVYTDTLVRLLPNGSFDTNFATAGIKRLDFVRSTLSATAFRVDTFTMVDVLAHSNGNHYLVVTYIPYGASPPYNTSFPHGAVFKLDANYNPVP